MKKIITVAILGCGNRGTMFAESFKNRSDRFKVVSLCDRNPVQIEKIHRLYGLEETKDYFSDTEFFKEKRADAVVIATDDRYHVEQCLKAMELGYGILLEKPISDRRDEVETLLEKQEQTGCNVVVCHELRYAPGFQKCAEMLRSGVVGDLYAIDASERAVYWHWAQAYVRGVETLLSPDVSAPAILAKCSHDLDLIQAYAQSECDTLTSVGDRYFFTKKNAPKDATERCLDCPHVNDCPYSAKLVYVDSWHKAGEPKYGWPYNKASLEAPFTEEALLKGLRTRPYGKCVFRCNTDLVDHQFVQMRFKNGVKASLKMVYGSEPGRRIAFYGTYGEIVLDERSDEIEIMVYGKEKETIRINTLTEQGNAHGGGDGILIDEWYEVLIGTQKPKTTLRESLESHLMGIAAEESRKSGGASVKVHGDE